MHRSDSPNAISGKVAGVESAIGAEGQALDVAKAAAYRGGRAVERDANEIAARRNSVHIGRPKAAGSEGHRACRSYTGKAVVRELAAGGKQHQASGIIGWADQDAIRGVGGNGIGVGETKEEHRFAPRAAIDPPAVGIREEQVAQRIHREAAGIRVETAWPEKRSHGSIRGNPRYLSHARADLPPHEQGAGGSGNEPASIHQHHIRVGDGRVAELRHRGAVRADTVNLHGIGIAASGSAIVAPDIQRAVCRE